MAGVEFSQQLPGSLAAEGGGKWGDPWAGCGGRGTGRGVIQGCFQERLLPSVLLGAVSLPAVPVLDVEDAVDEEDASLLKGHFI